MLHVSYAIDVFIWMQRNKSANGNEGNGTVPSPKKMKGHPPVWQLVKKNIYLHRERKREDEDDIMICQCPQIWGTDTTTIGCGESCLNRMLNIECHPKYCPCGERCTNQCFTKRQYAKLDVRRAGAKGFGLFAGEDLKAGQFLIEYVGEILEEDEYLRRKKFFTASGQRHFYFMNVGNGEVIDASRKGGLGRYINHSCQPNCETQKWVVRGEIAIGLFTLEDVPAGTELTFDYNFERYGDRPMKCLCGTPICRGFIGGTQESMRLKEIESESSQDEDELEPIMVTERETDRDVSAILDRVVGLGWDEGWSESYDTKIEKLSSTKSRKGKKIISKEVEEDALPGVNKALTTSKKGQLRKGNKSKRTLQDPDWVVSDSNAEGEEEKTASSKRVGGSGIPKRSSSGALGSVGLQSAPRRRSEIDRKLEEFLSASGRLKDTSAKSIVRFLRLFNLCDISPIVEKDDSRQRTSEISKVEANNPSKNHMLVFDGQNGADEKQQKNDLIAHGFGMREEGEIGISAQDAGDVNQTNSADHKSHGPKYLGGKQNNGYENTKIPLTGRQRARIADLSLLLDVVLKTGSPKAMREFVNCGILRQILGCLARNTGDQYAVILRKALRTVEALPSKAEDVQAARSAHGSFVDFLKLLGSHSDFEIRTRSMALLRKYQLAPSRLSSGDFQSTPQNDNNVLHGSNFSGHSFHRKSPAWERDPGYDRKGEYGGFRGRKPYRVSAAASDKRYEFVTSSPFSSRCSSDVQTDVDSRFSPYPPPPPPPPRRESHKRSRWDQEGDVLSTSYDRNTSQYDGSTAKFMRSGTSNDVHGSGEHDLKQKDASRLKSTAKHASEISVSVQTNSYRRNTNGEEVMLYNYENGKAGGTELSNSKTTDDRFNKISSKKLQKSGAGPRNDMVLWESPDESFEAFVSELVRHRVGKYQQPSHPSRLDDNEAASIFKQIVKKIMMKEREAFDERCRLGAPKPLERGKLEPRIKEYVRESVKKYRKSS